MSSESKALALLSATPAKVQKVHLLKQAGKAVAKRTKQIFRSEHDTAINAVGIGLMLWQVKSASAHGEFQPWIKQHAGERAYRSCAYYMKLALTFAEKAKLTGDECFAATTLTGKAPKAGAAATAHAKLEKFIGDLSLTELLIKHGIKGVGLKGELTDGDQTPAALTDAEQAQQQLELNWAQAYEPAKSLADLIAAQAAGFLPEQRAALEAELKRALDALRAA